MLLKDKSKFIVAIDWTTEIRITNDIIDDTFHSYREPLYITKSIEAQGEELGIVNGTDVSSKGYCFAYYVEKKIDEPSFVYVHKLAENEYYYLQVAKNRVEDSSDNIFDGNKMRMILSAIDFKEFPLFVNQGAADELKSNESSLESEAVDFEIVDIDIYTKPSKEFLMVSNVSKWDNLKKHRLLFILLIGFSVFLYLHFSEKEVENVPLLSDIKAAEKAKIRKAQEDFIKAEINKHSKTPNPIKQAKLCLESSLVLPVTLAGWQGNGVTCNSDRAVKSFIRLPNTGHPENFNVLASEYGLTPSISIGKGGAAVGSASSQPFVLKNREPMVLSELPKLSAVRKVLKESFFPLMDSSCSFNETVGYFNSPTEQPLDDDLNIAHVDYHVICKSLSFFYEIHDLEHLNQPYFKFQNYSKSERDNVMSFKYLAR